MAVPRYSEVPVDLPTLDLYTKITTMALDLRRNFVATAVVSIY